MVLLSNELKQVLDRNKDFQADIDQISTEMKKLKCELYQTPFTDEILALNDKKNKRIFIISTKEIIENLTSN